MSEFTPRGKMIIHLDWDIRKGRHGASAGHVIGTAHLVGTGRTREFAGTEAEVTEWAFNMMAGAGERGVVCEVRDPRGVPAE
jgi:hypothetical protein